MSGWSAALGALAAVAVYDKQRDLLNKGSRAEIAGLKNAGKRLDGFQGDIDSFNQRNSELYNQDYLQSERALGARATEQLSELSENPQQYLQNLPGYQFQLQQGTAAINNNAALRGRFGSGSTAMSLQRYGQGLASNAYNSEFNRLSSLSRQGASYEQMRVDRLNAANSQSIYLQQGLVNAQAGIDKGIGDANARKYGNKLVAQQNALSVGAQIATGGFSGGGQQPQQAQQNQMAYNSNQSNYYNSGGGSYT